MDKYKLIQMKKRLLALGLTCAMYVTAYCTNDENKEPIVTPISAKYSNIEDYYKYDMRNGKKVKVYNSQNVYLFYNNETYEVNEYIFNDQVFLIFGGELYDLETEKMLTYNNGIGISYNIEFFKYLIKTNYPVCLKDINNYIVDHDNQEYYSFDEIKNLALQIQDILRSKNYQKIKRK